MRERLASRHLGRVAAVVVGCALNATAAAAQTAGPLTLNDAIQLAIKNYPAVKEGLARAHAAEEGVGVAKTAYLPRLDMYWQENRATTNNVFGVLLPQSTIFSMTAAAEVPHPARPSCWPR